MFATVPLYVLLFGHPLLTNEFFLTCIREKDRKALAKAYLGCRLQREVTLILLKCYYSFPDSALFENFPLWITVAIKDLKAPSDNQRTKAMGLGRESVAADGRSDQTLFSLSLLEIRNCAAILFLCCAFEIFLFGPYSFETEFLKTLN